MTTPLLPFVEQDVIKKTLLQIQEDPLHFSTATQKTFREQNPYLFTKIEKLKPSQNYQLPDLVYHLLEQSGELPIVKKEHLMIGIFQLTGTKKEKNTFVQRTLCNLAEENAHLDSIIAQSLRQMDYDPRVASGHLTALLYGSLRHAQAEKAYGDIGIRELVQKEALKYAKT